MKDIIKMFGIWCGVLATIVILSVFAITGSMLFS
jgi:hypothetical protein